MLQKGGQAGEKRRACLLVLLKESNNPLKAADLAKTLGVSRQVIVQDMALLRAQKEPIMATPGGYVYLSRPEPAGVQKVITIRHSPENTEEELNILVDHGVTVIDVGVEHSVYGRIFRPLGLKNRKDVQEFIKRMAETDSVLLCSLTDGLHLHTIEGPDEQTLDQACAQLAVHGFLVE